MTLGFWLVESFLNIFQGRYAYKKYSSESKLTPDINYSITRHVKMISRQLRDIFVDFQKIILQVSQISKFDVQKSFFQRPTRLGFWLVESFLSTFQVRYAYEKHSLESKLTLDINYSITRYVKMISRQLRNIFVDFQKIILRMS